MSRRDAQNKRTVDTKQEGLSVPMYGFYFTKETAVIVLFDLRIPGGEERLHRERAAWQEQSTVEALDEHHFVLIVSPGGARRLAP